MSRSTLLTTPLLALVAGLVLLPTAQAGQKTRKLGSPRRHCLKPSFQGLGDLPGGGVESLARGISPDGSTVVGYSLSAAGKQAFLWTEEGGMVGLGDLAGGAFESDALSVASYGTAVVGGATGASGNEAFRWTLAGGMQSLGDLPGGTVFSHATDVSAAGDKVVGYSESANGTEAFLYTTSGGMSGLGDLLGGQFFSRALGISTFGNRIVGEGFDTAGQRALAWDLAGAATILRSSSGPAPIAGFSANADGSVIVGTAGDPFAGVPNEAFRWEGSAQTFGLTPFQTFGASGSSATGQRVVGQGFQGASKPVAWMWDADNGVRDLESVLASDYGLSIGGWRLEGCTDISGDGQRIVGVGINPSGKREAFLAVLPIRKRADINRDGVIDLVDLAEFTLNYQAQTPVGDFNGDGFVDLADLGDFSAAYNSGC